MSISSEITSMGENLKKDYQSIANLGADLTGVDKNIENIAELLDGVYDRLPKTEFEEGEGVTLENCLKGKLDYENGVVGIGQTEQDGTPTPSTPIDIECVTGNQDVVVSGINEINVEYPTTTAYGVTCTRNSDGTYTFNGTAERDLYFDICYFTLPVGTHKLVGCPSGGSWNNYIQYIRREDGQPFSINDSGSGGTGEVVGNEGQLRLSIMIKSGYACSNLLFKPMVTKDTSLTYADFEPYHTPTSYQLSLGERKIFEGDYLWIDKTTRKKYHHHKMGETIFDGTETFIKSSSYPGGFYIFWDLLGGKINERFLCSHAINVSSTSDYVVGTCYSDNSCSLRLWSGEETPTLESFQSKLATLYANGTPVTIVYQLATETDEEITGTLAEQLNAWYNAHSNNGTTIITSNGNLPMVIKVRALKGE